MAEKGSPGPLPSRGNLNVRLLVSAENRAEASIAACAGVDLIDLKDPKTGSLGRADLSVAAAVIADLGSTHALSAALGEWVDGHNPLPELYQSFRFVKWGLSRLGKATTAELIAIAASMKQRHHSPVLVCYADAQAAQSPPWERLVEVAAAASIDTFLIDTFTKNGQTLLDHLSPQVLATIIARLQRLGIAVALAGSLQLKHIELLKPLQPDWFAVRGAACSNGNRRLGIDPGRIKELLAMLNPPAHSANTP